MNRLIWNHKILKSQKTFIWNFWLSNKFLLSCFLNNVGKSWRSKSCVCGNWNFLKMRLFWNIRTINLRSLCRSKILSISLINMLRILISKRTRLVRLNDWTSINYSKIIDNRRSVSFVIAGIIWNVNDFTLIGTFILNSFSVFTIWRRNFMVMGLFWISLFCLKIILFLSEIGQIFCKVLLLLIFLLLVLIIGLRLGLHFKLILLRYGKI